VVQLLCDLTKNLYMESKLESAKLTTNILQFSLNTKHALLIRDTIFAVSFLSTRQRKMLSIQ